MFGEHDLTTAQRIAAEKTKELGTHCVVIPVDNKPGLYTIGVALKPTSKAELFARLKGG